MTLIGELGIFFC